MDTSTTDSQALPQGARLEEFVIEKVLGAGGFGITYLARDTSLGRQVVIKENLPTQFVWRETAAGTVRPRHSTGSDTDDFEWSMKNFLREAETLASLDHPGIVRVLRKFEANGTAYFVMPFVEGVPFDSLIEDRNSSIKPFSEEELRGLLGRMLQTLAYLHDRGIYHRDIKPGNILFTSDDAPVLIDFGSARQRLGERSLTVIESPGYTPFEQLQSRGNVGPWSDLYALGGTLCKAITGAAPPKANDRAFDDPFIPLAARPELIAAYSSSFLQCLDRALAMKPADRWQDAGEWLTALRQTHPNAKASAAVPPRAFVPDQAPLPEPSPSANRLFAGFNPIIRAVRSAYSEVSHSAWRSIRRRLGKISSIGYEKYTSCLLGIVGRRGTLQWIVVACLLIGLFALAKSNFGDKFLPADVVEDPASRQVREQAEALAAQARAAKAEEERLTRESEQKQAEVLARQELQRRQIEEKKRLETERRNRVTGSRPGEIKSLEVGPGVTMSFSWIPAGTFIMGSPERELGRQDDEIQRRVTLSNGFWMAKTEVTQAQWKAVMGGNPSAIKSDDFPVESVSWNDICGNEDRTGGFLGRANAKAPNDLRFDLPTEAEWEYACRAGSVTSLNSGKVVTTTTGRCKNLSELAWYLDNSVGQISDHSRKKSNSWGLYDMHGNVQEWCADWYGAYLENDVTDPKGAVDSTDRSIRGGCFSHDPTQCRSAYRLRFEPTGRNGSIGFRPVLRISPEQNIVAPLNSPATDYPVAKKVPGKTGFVYSPFDNKIIDVQDIPSGKLVQDPTSPSSAKKYFRVP